MLGPGCLDESEVPGVLVVEAARHAAAQLQPVLLELRHACLLVPGRAVCPALGTGDGGHRGMPRERQGQAAEPTKSAIDQDRRPWVGSGAGLVGGALVAGVGHASTVRPDPSTLGVGGERGSHHESCSPVRSR